MDKLRAMQLFVRVVETGALSRAADSLQLPRATATTLIQRLEAELGVRLLERSTRRVTVTADGTAYYERCVALLADLQETEDALRRHHATPRGRLRVDLPTLMARLVIVPALPAFFARYPDIELALASSDHHANLLEEGIDCAVWSGELADSDWVARRVGYLYFATCAAPSYLAAQGRPAHPDDLARHRCINRFRPPGGRTEDWVYSKNGVRVVASRAGQVALKTRTAISRRPRRAWAWHASRPSCSRMRWSAAAWNWCWATGFPIRRRSMSSTRAPGTCRASCACSWTGSPNCWPTTMAFSCARR